MSGATQFKRETFERDVERALDSIYAGFEPTVPRNVFKEMLLRSEGWVMLHGHLFDLVGKSLGAGVYRVTLRRRA